MHHRPHARCPRIEVRDLEIHCIGFARRRLGGSSRSSPGSVDGAAGGPPATAAAAQRQTTVASARRSSRRPSWISCWMPSPYMLPSSAAITVPASARAAAPASWVSSGPRTAARPMSRPLTLFETCPARRASQTTSALPSSRTCLSGCAWRSPEPMWRRRQSTAPRLPGRRSPRYPVPRASAPRRGRAHAPRASRSSRPRPRRRHHRR